MHNKNVFFSVDLGYFIAVGPLSAPLAMEGNAWTTLTPGGDKDWPDMQFLVVSVTAASDRGLLLSSAIGMKPEARTVEGVLIIFHYYHPSIYLSAKHVTPFLFTRSIISCSFLLMNR